MPLLCGMLLCLYSVSQQSAAPAIKNLRAILEAPASGTPPISSRDAQSKKKSAALIKLLLFDKSSYAWSYLALNTDPSLRSYFVRDIGKSAVPMSGIFNRLRMETDISVRRALILSLGGYSEESISLHKRKEIVDYLLALYRSDPDAGIHSSVDWLLRYSRQGMEDRAFGWEQESALRTIDSLLKGHPPGERNWYVTGEGHMLSIIRGPVRFTMGSPGNEPGRDKSPMESEHRQEIPRSFAIATKEVTVEQFQEFLDANPDVKKIAEASGQRNPTRAGVLLKSKNFTDDCPQISMTWFEAAQYCNWLSQKEGIPESEWCYPSLQEIREGMVMKAGYLQRTGYRLPTEAEFEYACRAGATTSRFFGTSQELLREYAWYTGNSFNEKPWPVGQLKPNDFGLFDMNGNVWEWGQDLVKIYDTRTKDTVWRDTEDSVLTISKDYKRPRKGGSYTYNADFQRSAYRNEGYIPDERRDNVGFRVARTIRLVK